MWTLPSSANIQLVSKGDVSAKTNVSLLWPGETLKLGLIESRPTVQVLFIGRFLAVASLGGEVGGHAGTITAGNVTWFAATVAVYVFNGIMDVPEDRGNCSRRPIASGRLTLPAASWFAAGAAVAALALGALAGIEIPLVVFLVLGYVYSGPPRAAKRSAPAASAVVMGLGLVTSWASVQASGGTITTAILVFALVMSAWMGLVGAVVKDLGDALGDAIAGRRTFAVLYGVQHVARWAGIVAVTVAVAGLAAAIVWAPVLVPAMLALFVGAILVWVRCGEMATRRKGKQSRGPYRAFMIAQYSFISVTAISLIAKAIFL